MRFLDNFIWFLKYGRCNYYYNAYGLDIVNSNSGNYEDDKYMAIIRDCLNYTGNPKYSQNGILKDKHLFYRYMKDIGLPTPAVFAYIINGELFDIDMQSIDINKLKSKKNYFIKSIDVDRGAGVTLINDHDDFILKQKMFSNGRFVLQERLTQHSELNRLYSASVNTLRLLTVKEKNDKVKMLVGCLRVGTLKSGNVDNWGKGGIAVGIKKDGSLYKYGFYKPYNGLGNINKENYHPESKVEFENFIIPNFKIAVDIVIKAHEKYFYGLHSIGWDMAITENGCSFIEGNDKWITALFQVTCGGMKKEWHDSITQYVSDKELKKYYSLKKHPLSWLYKEGII